VLVLNGDAWPEAGALSRLVAAARGRPHIGAVAPLLLDPSGAFERSTWPWPSVRLSLLYATGLRRLVPRPLAERWLLENAWQHDSPRAVGWAIGAALLVSREVLTSVGGLDERFFMYGEDVEWCWRMHDAGYRIWFEPAAVVRHVGGASAEQRFAGDVTARKAIASAEVMRLRRGALVAWLWRMLESITAARVWVQARHRRDSAGMHWARSVLQAHLRPRCVGE
jgi:GT2 family glycosyltransferase